MSLERSARPRAGPDDRRRSVCGLCLHFPMERILGAIRIPAVYFNKQKIDDFLDNSDGYKWEGSNGANGSRENNKKQKRAAGGIDRFWMGLVTKKMNEFEITEKLPRTTKTQLRRPNFNTNTMRDFFRKIYISTFWVTLFMIGVVDL